MKKFFGSELEVGLIKKGENRPARLSAEELHEFINYNEFDNFDPLRETYAIFVDEDGKFATKKFMEYSEMLGLPPITNEQIFKDTLGLNARGELSFERFAEVVRRGD